MPRALNGLAFQPAIRQRAVIVRARVIHRVEPAFDVADEQAFYLMSRGVPREAAERLIVMGFIEPIMQQVPFAPLQERLREEIEGRLHSQ